MIKSWHSLAGKRIWVTGGAGYLGSAITAALDECCEKAVCIDIADKAAQLVQERKLLRTVLVGLIFSSLEAMR